VNINTPLCGQLRRRQFRSAGSSNHWTTF
jgi:hypothetical protein